MEAGRKWTGSIETPIGGAGVDLGLNFGASASAGANFNGAADVDASGSRSSLPDGDGFHVEQRTESKRHAESKEVRELEDHSTEIRHKNETELRLDEVKVREFEPRPATLDEIRALLNAEFDALAEDSEIEVEISRDITVEEFTAVEKQYTTVDQTTGEKKTDVIKSESHSVEESKSKPKWMQESPDKLLDVNTVNESPVLVTVDEPLSASVPFSATVSAEAEVSDPVVTVSLPDVPQITTDLYSYLTSPALVVDDARGVRASGGVNVITPEKSKSGGGLFGKFKLNKKSKPVAVKGDIKVDAKASEDDVSTSSSVDRKKSKLEAELAIESGLDVDLTLEAQTVGGVHKHHEVKHKKHVIEEVILEDTDTFYEELGRKKPKTGVDAKKTNKENVKPTAERRRSTGEIPSSPVTELTGSPTTSTSNVSSEQQMIFVVSHDLPAAKTSKKSPTDRWSWTLPTFKGSGKDTDSPAVSESSTSKETKPKTIFGKQEEVVVEDTGLFTDSSIDRKKWGFRLKKTQLPSTVAELPESDAKPATTETVTFIVQPDPARSYIKVEPRVEDPDGLSANSGGDEIKTGAHGNIEFPKLKLFDKKQRKSTTSDDSEKTETVTYVVEPMDVQTPEVGASVEADAHSGLEFPTFKLPDIHMSPKKSANTGNSDVERVETVTFIVEQPASLVVDDAQQTPPDVHGKTGIHGDIHLPKFEIFSQKPDKHITGDISVETGKAGTPKKAAEEVETVTYVVEQASPDSEGNVQAKGKARFQGGFEMPKLNFSQKKSKDLSSGEDAHVETTETVTFIVSQPAVSVNTSDTGTNDDEKPHVSQSGGIGFPQIKLPSIHFGGKSSAETGNVAEGAETVTYVVETPTADIKVDSGDSTNREGKLSGYGGFEFPKFKLKSKPSDADGGSDNTAETTQTNAYVVEQPEDANVSGGRIEVPKIKMPSIHIGGKPSADKGENVVEGTETVTYVVKTPTADIKVDSGNSTNQEGKLSGHGGFEFPKFKPKSKPSDADGGSDNTAETTQTIAYVVEQPEDANVSGGRIKFPKIKMPSIHIGGKPSADKGDNVVEGTETVTYVVKTPTADIKVDSGDSTNQGGKLSGHGGFEFPKFKLKSKPSDAVDGSGDTAVTTTYVIERPEVANAGGNANVDVNLSKQLSNADDVDEDNKKTGRKWLPDIHFGVHHQREANVDTGETVTYVAQQPDVEAQPTEDGEKHRVGVELPKINVNLPTFRKKPDDHIDESTTSVVRNGEPEITTTTVTYVVDHTQAPEKDSVNKKNIGISLPKVSLNTSSASKDAKPDKEAKQKKKGKNKKDADLGVAVDESHKNSWGRGIHFGKKASVSSSDSSEKAPVEKSSTGIKWKVPKFHLRTKASYDVSVAPAEINNAPQTIDVVVTGSSLPLTMDAPTSEVNLHEDLQVPDMSLDLLSEMADVTGSVPGATVNVRADAEINPATTEEIPIVTVSAAALHGEPPAISADIDATPPSLSSSSSHRFAVNGYTERSERSVEVESAVDRIEQFVFTGGYSDTDDRIRVTTTQPLHMTSTPKKTTSDAEFNANVRSSASRQRPRSLHSDAGTVGEVGSTKLSAAGSTGRLAPWLTPSFIIVAIDFGTTFSGYAFCFPGDVTTARVRGEPLPAIHVMRKWEDGDPGAVDMKTPTTLLLTPEGEFNSFGFSARNFYHDLSPNEARRWLYFEKFKMALHYCSDLNSETELQAANGQRVKAYTVFSSALRYFRNHALQELSEQSQTKILNEDIRWVITVPAIWKEPAKQFMRETAYEAGIASADTPNQLLIALEPEAASIFVRRQRLHQLLPREEELALAARRVPTPEPIVIDHTLSSSRTDINSSQWSQTLHTSFQCHRAVSPIVSPGSPEIDMAGTKYMIVDCGGGTVDITVYEMITESGKLRELHQATGGPYGSTGIDKDFEMLLVDIFGADFIEAFKHKRPAGWVDLLLAFESRKRAATPFKSKPLNVSLPFSFTDFHKKYRNCAVEAAIRRYNSKDVSWSQQGMLRLQPDAMNRLFQPTIECIKEHIANVLNEHTVRGLRFIFLVGGFAESPMLQLEIRNEFSGIAKILIPNDASLTILKGAVCYGLEPGIIASRKSRMTYGVAVVNRFQRGRDPESKLVVRDGVEWCVDVFDVLVRAGDSVGINDPVVRSYAPVTNGQRRSVFTVYASESPNVRFVTDPGVRKCGALRLELDETGIKNTSASADDGDRSSLGALSSAQLALPREIRAKMTFGDTEIKVMAVDVVTGKSIRAQFDFMTGSG